MALIKSEDMKGSRSEADGMMQGGRKRKGGSEGRTRPPNAVSDTRRKARGVPQREARMKGG